MKVIFAVFLFLFVSSAAMAQENPCAADIEKFCKKEFESKGNFVGCLQDNDKKLSSTCKAHHTKMNEMLSVIKPNCHPDYQKHCTTSGMSKKDISDCMESKKKDFSTDCKKQMDEAT